MFIHWGVYSKLRGVRKGVNIVPETRNPKSTASADAWLQGEWGLYFSHSINWMDGGDAGNAQYKKEQPKLSAS